MKKVFEIKYFEIGLHILFWILYFTYPIIKFGDRNRFSFDFTEAVLNTVFIGVSVYIAHFFLVKNYKGIKALIVFLIIFLCIVYLNCYLNGKTCQCNFRLCFINKTVEYLLINAFFLAIFTIKKNIISNQILERTEQERVQAELKSLKAQLNPHFLFNTLNMLYSNAILKDEVLADKILKLSDSLHYLMHEGEKPNVPLLQEIEFINGYIELQKARLGKKIDIKFSNTLDNPKQDIPPLLMIPFIENAFKYSSMVEGKKIPLCIDVKLANDVLNLWVENRYDPRYSSKQSEVWKDSGIGIENVKKRLALLYPNKHTLTIESLEGTFKVNLKIDLK
ncbi:sensor histidine kinase YesM [Aquimarina sp. EL_43]|uniref:sensor histidine kinase n=1 Tax=unclassified Aquimarina TaxID=2627091 RepID=UPI0018C90A94|nr:MULTISPECIES: histidine kinase [unclassified Aquimarina]MBG6129615.1 sensor histidine kinase YesM [Aquimarina sp. EL_35]MBG6150680.1 sensor histidine kinase YesM [Aquimarina sp. EL_32]MBG6168013.1 sensor histidine kinase YesM [Aquimarina sp. EL_43]